MVFCRRKHVGILTEVRSGLRHMCHSQPYSYEVVPAIVIRKQDGVIAASLGLQKAHSQALRLPGNENVRSPLVSIARGSIDSLT